MKAGERLGRETTYRPASRARAAAALRQTGLAKVREQFKQVRVFKVREPSPEGRAIGKALTKMPRASEVFVALRHLEDGGTARLEAFLAYKVKGQLVQIQLLSH